MVATGRTSAAFTYHLENSHYLTVDALDQLIISHPGDAYAARHSVRIADAEVTPIIEIGQQGNGPGEFETPTGVATVGEACTYEGPYEVDPATLLLLHFDGSVEGAQGEVGTAFGTDFTAGKYDAGLLIDNGDSLTYSTAGNLNRETGSIEFWLRPDWNGNDFNSYTFFESGQSWFNRLRIMKDGANNLRFMVWDSSTEYGVAHNVANWQAGDWHHIAATWNETTMTLYVDGEAVDSRADARPPDLLADTLYVGLNYLGSQQANATIDELRVSDILRVGNSDSCNYRLLVADGGNHRLQVFDSLGNFISAFGGPGSGPGQFNWPRGLAVDGLGRVIVADSGNNRLQVLTFDGEQLSYAATYEAALLDPHDVAVGPANHLVVADTGHSQVKLLGPNGLLLATYDTPDPPYTGSFLSPQGVAVDGDGVIVVADTGRQRVVSISNSILKPYVCYLPAVSIARDGSCPDIIVNGGFETDAGWQLPLTPYPAVYDYAQAHSGLRSLRTGIAEPGANILSYSSAWQLVTVPDTTSQATLALWVYLARTSELASSMSNHPLPPPLVWPPVSPLADDAQYILILDEYGQLLETLFWAQSDDRQWQALAFDLRPYAGQTIRIHFGSFNNGLGPVTAMYVDDVSLLVCPP